MWICVQEWTTMAKWKPFTQTIIIDGYLRSPALWMRGEHVLQLNDANRSDHLSVGYQHEIKFLNYTQQSIIILWWKNTTLMDSVRLDSYSRASYTVCVLYENSIMTMMVLIRRNWTNAQRCAAVDDDSRSPPQWIPYNSKYSTLNGWWV